MARKKVVTTEETDGDEAELLSPGVPAQADFEPDPDMDVIEELKALAGDDGVKWIVHKISTKPGERGGWCAEYQTGELSLSGLRDTFGGGRYKIQGRGISGGRIIAQRTLDVIDTPKPPGANGGANGGIDVAALAAALKPGDNAMLPLLLKMMESNTQQMTALFNGLNRQSDNKQPSAMELVALIKALQPEKRDGEESAVALLLKGLDLGREMGGGGTDWMDLAKSGLGLVKPLVEAQARAAPALPAPVAPPAVTPPALAPPAQSAQPAPTNGVDPMLQQLGWLKAQLNNLVIQAAKHNAGRGGDPELYADIVLDNLPPYIDPEQLYARLAAEDALAQLVQVDARVNQYLPWFAAFRQAILDSFAPEEGGVPDEGNAEA